MKEDIEKILFTEEELKKIVAKLGEQITRDYQGKDLYLVTLLKGAVVFFTDVIRKIDLPVEMDFMAVSSYGNGTSTSGQVKILKDLNESIEGKDVLIFKTLYAF